MSSGQGPTRLAFCITELNPGGAERMLVELVIRLDRTEFEPAVFCLGNRGPLADRLAAADVPVFCLGASHRFQIWIVAELARQLKRWRPALLQCFLFHANIAGRLAGRMARVPCIVSGIRVAEHRSRVPLWLDGVTRGLVDHNVCVSQGVAEFTLRYSHLSPRKLSVIANGVDLSRFENVAPADLTRFGIPAGSRTILSVGRLDDQKNPELLLQAAASLLPRLDDVHVLFVGDGPLRESLGEQVRQSGLANRIHFAGWRAEIPAIMRASTCLALTSLWEGMPNVVLEAMAAGLPVVAADVEGVRELLECGPCLVPFPSGQAADAQRALADLLADGDGRREMAKTAQDLVRQKFTIEAMTANYAELYRELLANRRIGASPEPAAKNS